MHSPPSIDMGIEDSVSSWIPVLTWVKKKTKISFSKPIGNKGLFNRNLRKTPEITRFKRFLLRQNYLLFQTFFLFLI